MWNVLSGQLWPWLAIDSWSPLPTVRFTILEPQNQDIGETYVVQKPGTTDFEAPKLWKVRSGYLPIIFLWTFFWPLIQYFIPLGVLVLPTLGNFIMISTDEQMVSIYYIYLCIYLYIKLPTYWVFPIPCCLRDTWAHPLCRSPRPPGREPRWGGGHRQSRDRRGHRSSWPAAGTWPSWPRPPPRPGCPSGPRNRRRKKSRDGAWICRKIRNKRWDIRKINVWQNILSVLVHKGLVRMRKYLGILYLS